MNNVLNFNKMKKQYLTITLADANNTTIMVGTPTKKIMDDLILLQGSIETMQEDTDGEAMDGLYSACAGIMSRNKGGIKITKDFLEENLDLEDIMIFFNAYMNFIDEIGKSKN